MSASRSPARDGLVAVGLLLLALAVHAPLLRWNLSDGDEGYLLTGVERLLDGQVLYRDFERNYPPGLYYLCAALFRCCGASLLVTRVVALVSTALTAALAYRLARSAAPRGAAFVAALVPILLPPPVHKAFVPLCVVLGLLLCRALLEPRGRRGLFLCGLGLGALACFRHEVAGFCFLIGAATLALRAREGAPSRVASVGLLAGGVAAVWLPLLAAFAAVGAAGAMLEQLLLGGARINAAISIPWPGLGAFRQRPLETAIFYLPGIVAMAGVAAVVARRGSRTRAEGLVAQWSALAIAMHALVLSRSDVQHLEQVLLPPALVLAALAGGRTWTPRRPLARAGLATLAALAAALALGWGVGHELAPAYRGLAGGRRIESERVPVVLPEQRARAVDAAVAELRALTPDGGPIFVGPYGPGFYFLAERPNPTRYDYVFPGHSSRPEVQGEIVARLEATHTAAVLVQDVAWDGMEARRFPRYAPQLGRYLHERYEPVRRIGPWVILARKAE